MSIKGDDSDRSKYSLPGIEGRQGSMYDVERSPEEITRELMAEAADSSDDDETESMNGDNTGK